MGELLVISDLLVKEMRKTENNQLSAQEVYNLELTKLQSEKAAKIKANLGQRNRFQDFLRERVDENLLSAAPPQVYRHELIRRKCPYVPVATMIHIFFARVFAFLRMRTLYRIRLYKEAY